MHLKLFLLEHIILYYKLLKIIPSLNYMSAKVGYKLFSTILFKINNKLYIKHLNKSYKVIS
jgi:hypothetical protein